MERNIEPLESMLLLLLSFRLTMSYVTKTGKAIKIITFPVVPSAGIEPARLAALEFESSASTNSANWPLEIVSANIDIFLFLKRVFQN